MKGQAKNTRASNSKGTLKPRIRLSTLTHQASTILNSNVQSNSAAPGAPRPRTARNDRPTVEIVVSTTSGIKHCQTDTACPFKVLIDNSSHPSKLRDSPLTNGSPPNCKAFGDWSQLLISLNV